jgi:hypothetical protein
METFLLLAAEEAVDVLGWRGGSGKLGDGEVAL